MTKYLHAVKDRVTPHGNDKGGNSNLAVEKFNMYDCKQKSVSMTNVRIKTTSCFLHDALRSDI